jgi:hypothetical protein
MRIDTRIRVRTESVSRLELFGAVREFDTFDALRRRASLEPATDPLSVYPGKGANSR